jgi:hypothetical protein
MKWIVPAAIFAATLCSVPASAQECGWYAVLFCSKSEASADGFANTNRGWGFVIATDDYTGFRQGYYCVVSNPTSKSDAKRQVNDAKANGISRNAYSKRACTDQGSGD